MNNLVSTDPIADMLTRIRNALAVGKGDVRVPYSALKEAVARLLKENDFIDGVGVDGEAFGRVLVLRLHAQGQGAHITSISRLSRPGARHYVAAKDIPVVKRGRGIVLVSTSKGLMTGDAARAQHIGGELLCEVY